MSAIWPFILGFLQGACLGAMAVYGFFAGESRRRKNEKRMHEQELCHLRMEVAALACAIAKQKREEREKYGRSKYNH